MGAMPTVGVFLPVRPTESMALEGHDGEFVAALERELRGHRRAVTLYGIASLDDIPPIAGELSGAVLLGFRDDEIESLPDLGVPVAAIDSYLARSDLSVVRADDFDGGRRAGAYLATWSHRDILFVGPAHSSGVVRERYAGFISAMPDSAACALAVTSGTNRPEGVAIGRALWQNHPTVTAVFAVSDTLALGVIEGLALSGHQVPFEVSVIGFDDLAIASLTTPKLSSVAQDIPRKARLAAQTLLRRDPGSDLLIVGVDIVERASVGAPAHHHHATDRRGSHVAKVRTGSS